MSHTTRLQHASKEMMACLADGHAPIPEQRERWEELLFSPENVELCARSVALMLASFEEDADDENWLEMILRESRGAKDNEDGL